MGDVATKACKDRGHGETSLPMVGRRDAIGYRELWLVEAVRQLLGGNIDVDPASSEVAQQTVKANKYFTRDDNGP
jgi:hypothetical protein